MPASEEVADGAEQEVPQNSRASEPKRSFFQVGYLELFSTWESAVSQRECVIVKPFFIGQFGQQVSFASKRGIRAPSFCLNCEFFFFLQIKQDLILFFICVCQTCTGAQGGRKRMSDPPELELQKVVRYLSWVLGTELWTSVAAGALRTPTPSLQILCF